MRCTRGSGRSKRCPAVYPYYVRTRGVPLGSSGRYWSADGIGIVMSCFFERCFRVDVLGL